MSTTSRHRVARPRTRLFKEEAEEGGGVSESVSHGGLGPYVVLDAGYPLTYYAVTTTTM